ncbi:MAG: tRNA pseudouridine(38-40) synthase TruA [Actinobacteria bacterium]|nr:tRNA pseudouridine(38-40) synthase TruA [Actinomycetota bacterium]
MTVAYDGTGFSGFAPNVGVETVGGALAGALGRVLGHPVVLTCAGRTDAGVHAWGQVVSFDTSGEDLDLVGLQRSVNRQCGPRVVVREAAAVPANFDARRSARSRRYRYTVLNRAVPDPFLATTTWHVEAPLDLAALRLACDPLIGEHDFSSFCRPPKVKDGAAPPCLARRVLDARWDDLGGGRLRFSIEASAFCHQMVRSLVGTLVEMGSGRKRAGEMRAILESRRRDRAGQLAPAHGLCLWEVVYASDPEVVGGWSG